MLGLLIIYCRDFMVLLQDILMFSNVYYCLLLFIAVYLQIKTP
jgi:hypothetical protein